MSYVKEYLIEKEERIEHLGNQLSACYSALQNELPTETTIACLMPLLAELRNNIRDLATLSGSSYSVQDVEYRVLGSELASAVHNIDFFR